MILLTAILLLTAWLAAVGAGASGLVHLLLAMPMFTLSVILFDLILGPYRIEGPEESNHADSRSSHRATHAGARLRVIAGRDSSVD